MLKKDKVNFSVWLNAGVTSLQASFHPFDGDKGGFLPLFIKGLNAFKLALAGELVHLLLKISIVDGFFFENGAAFQVYHS